MALKLGLNLGYWGIGPQGEEAVEVVRAAERAGFDSVWVAESYGSDVVSVLAWLAPQTETIQLGAAIMQVPARPPAAAAMAGGDDRQALRRALHLRLRPLRAAGLRGLVRGPLREALGPHPRVHRDRAQDRRPRGQARARRRALQAAAARRRGQGAEAQLPPRCATGSRSSSARSAASRSRWRRRSATAGSRSSSASTPSRRPGASTSRPGCAKGGRAALRARGLAHPAGGDRRRPRGGARRRQGRPAPLSRRHGQPQDQLLRRPDAPLRLRRGRRRGPALYLDGKREEAYAAIPDELVDATALIGSEEEVAARLEQLPPPGWTA